MQAPVDREAACAPMGKLEYVVESRHHGTVETWLVLRPHGEVASEFKSFGVQLTPGCRVVVEADSLRPVGVLAADLPPAPPPAGYNPYFDLQPT